MDRDLPSLDLLRTFHAVHRTGSLSRAATQLGLRQSTVSARLHQLETRLSAQLFDRGAHGARPTPRADDLAAQLEQPLAELELIAAELTGSVDLARATVRLGAPAEWTERALAARLRVPAATGMRLVVTLGAAADLAAQLSAGQLDLMVSTVKPSPRTVWQALDDEEFVLVAAPSLAAGLDPELLNTDPARALRGCALVAYDQQQSIVRRWWRHVLGTPPPARGPQCIVPDLRGVQALVEAGIGMSVLPRYLCAEALAQGRLVVLIEPDDAPINTFYLVTLAHQRRRPAVAAVWAAIARE